MTPQKPSPAEQAKQLHDAFGRAIFGDEWPGMRKRGRRRALRRRIVERLTVVALVSYVLLIAAAAALLLVKAAV